MVGYDEDEEDEEDDGIQVMQGLHHMTRSSSCSISAAIVTVELEQSKRC